MQQRRYFQGVLSNWHLSPRLRLRERAVSVSVTRAAALCAMAVGLAALGCEPAQAWGDEGHRAVALIAQNYLHSRPRQRIEALLADDDTALTVDRGMESESVWADHWRDSDRYGSHQRYEATRRWHYINLPLLPAPQRPDVAAACAPREPLPRGTPASQGPAQACIVDKIEQFRAELADAKLPKAERRRALQFLLHLVADVHQPLHAVDDDDHGGNDKLVLPPRRSQPIKLHACWDHDLVRAISRDPQVIADRLARGISPAERQHWAASSSAASWALESYEVARTQVYANLPPVEADGASHYSAAQWLAARGVVELQLQRAGVRLAALLNQALK
jgi:hypothetical protein